MGNEETKNHIYLFRIYSERWRWNCFYAFSVSTNIIITPYADIWRTYGRQMVQCMLRQTALVSKIPNSNTIFRSMLKRWKILQFTFSHMKWIHRKKEKRSWRKMPTHEKNEAVIVTAHTRIPNRAIDNNNNEKNEIELKSFFTQREMCYFFSATANPYTVHSLTHSRWRIVVNCIYSTIGLVICVYGDYTLVLYTYTNAVGCHLLCNAWKKLFPSGTSK